MHGSLRPILGLTLTLGVLGGQQLVLVQPDEDSSDNSSLSKVWLVFIIKEFPVKN